MGKENRVVYLDIDDTYIETEKLIKNVCKKVGYSIDERVNAYILRDNPIVRDVVKLIMSDYSKIPKRVGAEDCLAIISTEYTVKFLSSCYSEVEIYAKKKFAEEEGKEVILCEYCSKTPDIIDLSNGIMIDDRVDVLLGANASEKYNMKYNYDTQEEVQQFIKEGGTVCNNWYQLLDYLVEGEKDEEFRRYFYTRIQELGWNKRLQGCK